MTLSNDDDRFANDPEDMDEGSLGLTVEEISEQAVTAFYNETWGKRSNVADRNAEPSEFARLHALPGTMHVSGLIDLAQITDSLFLPDERKLSAVRPPVPLELLKRRAEVRRYAEEVFGSEKKANGWFERPMAVVLNRRRPAEHLQTLEGVMR
ncbi:antitoxin Xre/MbcA/ParS toxin-binding domain-containing protein [Massilia aurea]|uniref:antitoxin Xre/MbcA/ParS toxin-binding domain-containing protein n=1 Tax=Massilia aurea TaxID=373040 RepID=UPI00346378B0